MAEFHDPNLVYFKPRSGAGDPIPAFRFELRTAGSADRWAFLYLLKDGRRFGVRGVLHPTSKPLPSPFSQVLGAVEGRQPLLPTKDELEDWLHHAGTTLPAAWKAKVLAAQETFCRTLLAHFRRADRYLRLGRFDLFHESFKGRTVGRSANESGFLMKGIKSAYDALGFYQKTYDGLRFSDFGAADLKKYVGAHRRAYGAIQAKSMMALAPTTAITQKLEVVLLGPPPGNPAPAPPATPSPTALQTCKVLVSLRDQATWKKVAAADVTGLGGATLTGRLTIRAHDPASPGVPAEYLDTIKKAMAYWATKSGGDENAKVMPKLLTTHKVMADGTSYVGMVGQQASTKSTFHDAAKTGPVIVHEYGFRGDTRTPATLYEAGGLHPNALYWTGNERDVDSDAPELDPIKRAALRDAFWKRLEKDFERLKADATSAGNDAEAKRLDGFWKFYVAKRKAWGEEIRKEWTSLEDHLIGHFDPFLHVGEELNALSAFLSVSTDAHVPRSFIQIRSATRSGFAYVIRCHAAIDQLATFRHVGSIPGEAEISVPGGVDWDDVIAYRECVSGTWADHGFLNETNAWRADERDLQDAAVRRLMSA